MCRGWRERCPSLEAGTPGGQTRQGYLAHHNAPPPWVGAYSPGSCGGPTEGGRFLVREALLRDGPASEAHPTPLDGPASGHGSRGRPRLGSRGQARLGPVESQDTVQSRPPAYPTRDCVPRESPAGGSSYTQSEEAEERGVPLGIGPPRDSRTRLGTEGPPSGLAGPPRDRRTRLGRRLSHCPGPSQQTLEPLPQLNLHPTGVLRA
mmetsp:Transcript_48979/g.116628  ORF Transcript_48979/g.116628 Transcript_48979/m.116628 type:complete len:206 (-) Transcript_48979:97-714(-)